MLKLSAEGTPAGLVSSQTISLPHGFRAWRSHAEIEADAKHWSWEWSAGNAFETQMLALPEKCLRGFCAVCQGPQEFEFESIDAADPNWRESLRCRGCGLINRWRLVVHFLRLLKWPDGRAYITERTTPLFERLSVEMAGLIGSEYFSPQSAPGESFEWNGQELRHEDVTRLSFADGELAAVLSFDVLEHVPDYRKAAAEIGRVLMPGGLLLLSVPFNFRAMQTVVRAEVSADGTITHHLPAAYHGDPLSDQGVLCYQDFGWDLLDELRKAGIDQLQLVTCWSPAYGYMGFAQPVIVGFKRGANAAPVKRLLRARIAAAVRAFQMGAD